MTTTNLPLEDSHLDIIGKAMRGLGIDEEGLAMKTGLPPAEIARILEGEWSGDSPARIAPALGLGAAALADAAAKNWHPQAVSLPGLETFTTEFDDMTVNAYLVWDAQSREAVAFDSGADASGMLDFARQNSLRITQIFLTHTHGDHIFDLDRLREKTGAPAWVGDREPALAGATAFSAGKSFNAGALHIETRLTWGHAEGGITYVVSGLSRPLAIVGDAIFAGSMGGGKVSYEAALTTTRKEILSLPPDTILASGHGPLTTVAEEFAHNPFFTT